MKIKANRHIWGAHYEGDNVEMRWHYQDVPSRCLCCGKDIDYYIICDCPIPICEDCLKESLKIIKQYKKDCETDDNPKIHYIEKYGAQDKCYI